MPTPSKRSAEDSTNGDEPSSKKTRKNAKSKPTVPIGMCSLSKKEFGDKIKDCFRLEKYDMSRTLISMDMDVVFFRGFFGNNDKINVTPMDYDESTPVVVAQLSPVAASEVFGVTKTKNGNRYKTVHLSAMVVILYPERKRAQAWVTA
ncbi:hypothetical protein GGR51DRAFT_561720 [Nemania sp. FL0031]|nr:hypothetical protein GGR51DRAFT_561720 [Nemania sp. FL0031]